MQAPRRGDKILILRANWLNLILIGEKTLEIRGVAYSAGKYYLGHDKIIYGSMQLGRAIPIRTDAQWDQLRWQHRVPAETMPYDKTFGLPILDVKPAARRLPFSHPKGAVCIVRYR